MYFSILNNNARRIYIDITQQYEAYLNIVEKMKKFQGGMKWIKRGEKEYLFRQRNNRGDGKSLGIRSKNTEEQYERFHAEKIELVEKRKSLLAELESQSKFCVAANINRVPKIAADVIRVIQQAKSNTNAIIIVGTHALFAYESMAGITFNTELLATGDIDLMWDAKRKLELVGLKPNEGLLDLLKKVDKTFERQSKATYRAANEKGYLVDLIKPMPSPPCKLTKPSITQNKNDLIAAEIENLDWLYAAPPIQSTVIGNDGFPVIFDVPDPRVFSAYKLWLSKQDRRDPQKKSRDQKQARAVLQLIKEYLPNYQTFGSSLKGLPKKLRDDVNDEYDNIIVSHLSSEVPGL